MRSYKLKQLLEIKNGRDYKHLNDGKIPVLGSGGIMCYVDNYIYDKESILLPRKGTLNNIQYINKPFWTVDTLYYSIVNKDLVEPYYLYHYLKKLDLSSLNSGTGVPSMTFGAYYGVEIKLPDLNTQKQIAKVLSDIDSKIELNNKINAELEAMAKLIYDYWFVQFDFPISETQAQEMNRPDLIGKPYKSSDGKMSYNPQLKREIPEGWEVKTLSEIATLKAGGDKPEIILPFPKNETNVPVFSNGITNNGLFGYTNQAKVFEPSITISARGTIGFTVIRNKPFVPIVRLIVIIPKINYFLGLIFHSVKRLNYEDSGSVQKQLTVPMIENEKILLPPLLLTKKFNNIFEANNMKIENIKVENENLTNLRDWLLPMLMNGQIKVK